MRLALNPKASDSKGLLKSNAPQFKLVSAALSPSDIDKASQLQTYAASDDWLDALDD